MLTANRNGRRTLANLLGELVPQRFADTFAGYANKPLSELSNLEIDEIGARFNSWQAKFSETEGYDRAEVTLGGESKPAVDGTWIHMPANLKHSVRAKSPTVMLLILLKGHPSAPV